MSEPPITFTARILRKQEDLPRYVVVAAGHVGGRQRAFPSDVMLNDTGPFRRNIRPWRKGSDMFFVNLTAQQCSKAGLDTNDTCSVRITPRE